MSFSVDQFMQVKCKLQLTSESESSESIHTNCEQVRLCASAQLDKNSALIVMVCSNETSNNHILAYYTERRQTSKQGQSPGQAGPSQAQESLKSGAPLTFAQLAQQDGANTPAPESSGGSLGPRSGSPRGRARAKTIIKQIYYHKYNEDIVALCLSESGDKLIMISASSTIYVLPSKNILLNLHAQQLRSSQGRSMYFYDATILNNLRSIDEPIGIACWVSASAPEKSYIIVACRDCNRLVFIDVVEKKELCSTSVAEPIRSIEIIRDRFSYSLLITCESYNQYRQTLELLDREAAGPAQMVPGGARPSIISLPKSSSRATKQLNSAGDETAPSERSFTASWASKPLPIKLNSADSNIASSAIHRVFTPASRFSSQASMSTAGLGDIRERPLSVLISQQQNNLIGVVDILGANRAARRPSASNNYGSALEPRLLRFYSSKQYFYRSQRPQVICKLATLEPDEMITHLVLTERFIALATDRDRCLINSRNCCRLKNPSPQAPIELDPLVKEVTFNNEEKILSLIRSPVTHDQDNILDSFILVTTRSIYSIDARHNCRDLFINLIDSHLAIKRTLFTPRMQFRSFDEGGGGASSLLGSSQAATTGGDQHLRLRSAESNLLINDFLQHREVYEGICHDSLAFSTLFKLELSSLYEAYADRLLQRHQFELANRFFHMAAFDHPKILGKYIRIGAHNETIDYAKSILSDENDFRKVLSENERLEMAKIAFECLLAKLLVERSKLLVYRTKLKRPTLDWPTARRAGGAISPMDGSRGRVGAPCARLDAFSLCEHSPKGQDAKLSATTIVGDTHEDEEATLTSNTDGDESSSQGARLANTRRTARVRADKSRLECERALVEFIKQLMPSQLYDYAIDRLLDFDLVELVEAIAQTEGQILSLMKTLIRNREDERLLFRTGRFELLTSQLERLGKVQLTKINTGKLEFLEFLTSPRVTRVLVRDISLTCDFYGYQHTLVQFRKYSFAALRHLETYKLLISMCEEQERRVPGAGKQRSRGIHTMEATFGTDEDANDGLASAANGSRLFDDLQKQAAEGIFVEFLTACLEESSEDSCRLWFNYINFYLNYMGDSRSLEGDILRLVESSGNCRLAISLYKAIYREETARITTTAGMSRPANGSSERKQLNNLNQADQKLRGMSTFLKTNLVANTPLEAMGELHNLATLFANEFLMRLLERTLDLLPQAPRDLDSLTIATMC